MPAPWTATYMMSLGTTLARSWTATPRQRCQRRNTSTLALPQWCAADKGPGCMGSRRIDSSWQTRGGREEKPSYARLREEMLGTCWRWKKPVKKMGNWSRTKPIRQRSMSRMTARRVSGNMKEELLVDRIWQSGGACSDEDEGKATEQKVSVRQEVEGKKRRRATQKPYRERKLKATRMRGGV